MLTNDQISWIRENTAGKGLQVSGDIFVSHERAWSKVAEVPTTSGRLYFKVTQPALIFEVRLTEALDNWGLPVPAVIAADTNRGWLLLADSGQPLRRLLQTDGDINHWYQVVTQYAQMQITLIARRERLLQLGIFDRRLQTLPALYVALLADVEALMIDQENGLSAAEYAQLQRLQPQFEVLCQQLAAFGIPETLHHDDFHDNNIFVHQQQYTFADWGEACLAHPFFSLIIVLGIAAYILKLADDDPALTALRDTYLQQWQVYGTTTDLQAAFALAQIIGAVNRALTWHTMLDFMDAAERAVEADAVPGWLQKFLRRYHTWEA